MIVKIYRFFFENHSLDIESGRQSHLNYQDDIYQIDVEDVQNINNAMNLPFSSAYKSYIAGLNREKTTQFSKIRKNSFEFASKFRYQPNKNYLKFQDRSRKGEFEYVILNADNEIPLDNLNIHSLQR
jgi:hypothetical protein